MRWSLTPFFNELDVLEIRLRTLDEWADRHVVAEATVTQTGQPKPLYFAENRERFAPWLDKIVHVVVDDMPVGHPQVRPADGDWAREAHQRNALVRGLPLLHEGLDPLDLVLISDCDEIPDPQQLRRVQQVSSPVRLSMAMHVYYLNWRWKEMPVQGGTRAVVAMGHHLNAFKPHELVTGSVDHLHGCAGWHLAYMNGGVDGILQKLHAIADDFRFPKFLDPERLALCRQTGEDLFGRVNRTCEWVAAGELPPCGQDDPDRFAHLLIEKPAGPPRRPALRRGR